MEIWLDSIDLETIADASDMISGVTTNPGILSAAVDVKGTLCSLLELQKGPVAVQVVAQDIEGMLDEAEKIFAFSPRMIVKVPVNRMGLRAMAIMREKQIPVIATGVFTPSQALLAARQGVRYIAPYFSHMREISDPRETLKVIHDLLQKYETRMLVASLKTVEEILFCAHLGAAAITIKEELYRNFVADHPLERQFTQKFHSNWQNAHGAQSIREVLNY